MTEGDVPQTPAEFVDTASLTKHILNAAEARDRRLIVAVAGPPAAGKSTLAQRLCAEPTIAVLGQDAFHYDDDVLARLGRSERKGAPDTFDVAALGIYVEALMASPRRELSVPIFDRDVELSRNCAAIVEHSHDVVVVEGNWLLLASQPWSQLSDLWDLTVWVDAPLAILEQRIVQRWLDQGLSPAAAHDRWLNNDGKNVELCRDLSLPPNLGWDRS